MVWRVCVVSTKHEKMNPAKNGQNALNCVANFIWMSKLSRLMIVAAVALRFSQQHKTKPDLQFGITVCAILVGIAYEYATNCSENINTVETVERQFTTLDGLNSMNRLNAVVAAAAAFFPLRHLFTQHFRPFVQFNNLFLWMLLIANSSVI